jgi:hypothetical protein
MQLGRHSPVLRLFSIFDIARQAGGFHWTVCSGINYWALFRHGWLFFFFSPSSVEIIAASDRS